MDRWPAVGSGDRAPDLTNSGVRWLHSDPGRWQKLDDAAAFFRTLLKAPVPRIAIENPVMHRYAIERIGRKQDQVIQPWMFGHTERKATGLWLRNLPSLKPTNDVRTETMALPARERDRVHHMSPGPERWKKRSRTYPGIARAMAEQWGSLLTTDLELA